MILDRFDKNILSELQRDGRISNVQLAGLVSLSESACLRRVRALEESGLIERYAALLDQKKAGLSGTVFVHIALRREEQSELAAFETAVQNIPEVMECYLMTGEFDYLLRVVVADMADFERKFMHLGFHIYDVGFQSPNVEAAKPMVFATALLLILIVVALSLGAIILRNKLRKKYTLPAV